MGFPGTVGVAGCGRMGLPMARALARAGVEVWGFDIRPAADFGEFAPRMIADPAAFARRCETVLSVVRDVAQTEALLFDDQALLRAPGCAIRTLVVCSTVSPRWLAGLPARARGLALVDAPMSGAQVAAEEARLSFMLGGAEADLDRLAELFDAMGRASHRMGPFGAGMTAKVLNNFVAACATLATRRSLGWADALGVDRDRLLALMEDSSGQTWFGSNFDRIEFARDGFAPDNSIGLLVKDVAAALDAAQDEGDPFGAALQAGLKGLAPLD
ncbi:MAG: NAD(P)-dependent oxidoreductase [Rubrimonas sp.]|uniref:NAD(P)-dependent oxidoreductase n=1 Tax=Rubrimonas sp. TaxID=2036015 RepID=UPI002FDE841B